MSVAPDDDLPCRDLVELLTDHLEGALDPQTDQRLRGHLADCDGCATHLEQLRVTTSLVAAAAVREQLPPGLRSGLAEAFRRRGR